MKLNNVGVVIAQRELSLSTKAIVTVVIGKPEPFPDGNGCYCPYQIIGLGDQKVRYAGGEDAAQALMLTLQTIGAVLYASHEAKSGLLTWNGGTDLGFPDHDFNPRLSPP